MNKNQEPSKTIVANTPPSHKLGESLSADAGDDHHGSRPSSWWTGLEPLHGLCPGVDEKGQIHSLPQLRLDHCTRAEMLDYFNNTWAITEVLFSALQGREAFVRPPAHQLRHPLIFYYGHPAVLYVNKLRLAGLLTEPVDPEFEHLFETGVDEMSWDDMSKNEMQWPDLALITQYRRKVYGLVKNLIETHPAFEKGALPFLPHTPAWSMAMSFEHERIHIETSSVLIRELPIECLRRPEQWPENGFQTATTAHESHVDNPFCAVAEGVAYLGKSREVPTFGWDNEYGSEAKSVPGFSATQNLISHQEFLEFVKDGGYREQKYWSDEGWRWRQFRNTKWPSFWVLNGPQGLHEFSLRLVFEVVDWQPLLPAVVNYHEAKAFCAWRTEKDGSAIAYRLLSESEHHRLRASVASTKLDSYNSNLRYGSESPVNAARALAFGDTFGNVWQWTEDEFHPLSGFEVHSYYDDFSTPCFDGKHQMIMGGSFVSTGDEASAYARFHFRPHFLQHSGFRMVRPQTATGKTSFHFRDHLQNNSDYESGELLSQYLLLHFGDAKITAPAQLQNLQATAFPQRCAQKVIEVARREKIPMRRALDIGCATGGAVFELSKAYDHVIGVDLSDSFIKSAQALRDHQQLSYRFKVEGDLHADAVATLPSDARPERTQFRQADACSLPADYVGFDAVLVANLLCRLPSPKSCLSRMLGPRGLVADGGLLVLVSPYSWLEAHTQKSAWLGGFEKAGRAVTSEETLRAFLGAEFDLLESGDMPLVIREHARKYQFIVSNLMVWKKRGKRS